MNLKAATSLVIFLALALSSARCAVYNAREKSITGRVLESPTSNAVVNITIKLTPPKASAHAQKLTTTNQKGEFTFRDVEAGRYLLEICQGLNVVYRKVFDTSHSSEEPILLTLKKTGPRSPSP
jgi:hypothetical protein